MDPCQPAHLRPDRGDRSKQIRSTGLLVDAQKITRCHPPRTPPCQLQLRPVAAAGTAVPPLSAARGEEKEQQQQEETHHDFEEVLCPLLGILPQLPLFGGWPTAFHAPVTGLSCWTQAPFRRRACVRARCRGRQRAPGRRTHARQKTKKGSCGSSSIGGETGRLQVLAARARLRPRRTPWFSRRPTDKARRAVFPTRPAHPARPPIRCPTVGTHKHTHSSNGGSAPCSTSSYTEFPRISSCLSSARVLQRKSSCTDGGGRRIGVGTGAGDGDRVFGQGREQRRGRVHKRSQRPASHHDPPPSAPLGGLKGERVPGERLLRHSVATKCAVAGR